jgi:hypothetical protein
MNLQITTGKKYSRLAIGWNVYYILLTHYTLVDRSSAMTPWGIPWKENSGINMGTVSAVRQERFEKRYYGRWLAAKEMSALLLQYHLHHLQHT